VPADGGEDSVAARGEAGLTLDGVSIAVGGQRLLSISHHVAPGEVLTVMGPSGSGKSALLAFIGGFLDPAFSAAGRAFVSGVELTALPAEDRHAGILFQDPLLFPHMSVAGNIAFAIPAAVRGRARRRQMAEAALEDVGLRGLGDRDPDTLSGGQKARVALARVLLAAPRTLLLDEPFSKLDTALRQQMRELVFGRAKQSALPVVLVTHDEADALAAGGPCVQVGA
jgi:putative thiamine transport system ATP-binding protein